MSVSDFSVSAYKAVSNCQSFLNIAGQELLLQQYHKYYSGMTWGFNNLNDQTYVNIKTTLPVFANLQSDCVNIY